MKASRYTTKVKIVLVGVILSVAYLYLSSPGKVVVQDNGEVKGLVNKTREALQGKRFWKGQLFEVNKELAWKLGEPRREAEFDQELRAMVREFEKEDEQFYRDFPDMRPSPVERHAEALRDRADALEQGELGHELEQWRLQRIAELRRIKRLVEVQAK